MLCRVMQVSTSAYCDWCQRGGEVCLTARSGGTQENEGAARRIHQQHGQRTADEATTKRRPGHLTLSNLHLNAKAGLGSEAQETSSYRPIANIANWWPDNVLNQDV